jgi:chromosome segregation ATPase
MAKGASPSQDQLLELLKRAADELKHAKEEARTAIVALQKEQAAHQQTETELEGIKNQTKAGRAQASTDEQLLKDQIDAERENSKELEKRVKELEQGLEAAIAEREAMRQRVTDGDTAISVTQQQEEAMRTALMQEHASALDALKAEHASALDALKAELTSALETQKTELEKALESAGAEQAEAEAHNKGMLDDAAGKLVTLETQLTQERDKHQATAHKLLETRSKVRELESTLAAEQEKVKTLEATIKQMSETHERELREKTHTLAQSLERAQGELAKVTDSWQQVERQYESLHREMLMTLEQRDDARRLLDNERAEKERLSRALQGQRS